MSLEDINALTRLIEFAQREAEGQGLHQTVYFLEMARNSLAKEFPDLPARGRSPASSSDVEEHGTGLQ